MRTPVGKKKSVAQAIFEEQYLISNDNDEKQHDHQEEEDIIGRGDGGDGGGYDHQEEEEDIIGGEDGGDGGDDWIDNFPPGYRFKPTDEELVRYYLLRKLDNKPLPHDKIKEVFLYQKSPRELTDDNRELGDNEWYFFTPRERKYKQGKRPNRKAGDGYWKATGADKKITWSGSANVIGLKKSLVFYEGKPPRGNKSEWIMHEYIANRPKRNKLHENDMRLDDWVLCRLRKKSESGNKPRISETNVFHANHVAPLEDHGAPIEEESLPQFSQINQATKIHMSHVDGHAGPTGVLANTHEDPRQNLHHDYASMDFNYTDQQNVSTPPLGYPVGTNSTISHYLTTQFAYSYTSNYQYGQLDTKQTMCSDFGCEIQALDSNVADSELTYILDDGEWADKNLSEMAMLDYNQVESVM